jgi:hypothetical protein
MQVRVSIVRILRGLRGAHQEQIVALMVPLKLDLVGVEKTLVGQHGRQVGILIETHDRGLTLLASGMHRDAQ